MRQVPFGAGTTDIINARRRRPAYFCQRMLIKRR
jgi:hypothetical protein